MDYTATTLLTFKDNPLNSSHKNNKGRGRGLDGYNNNPLVFIDSCYPSHICKLHKHYIVDFQTT